MAWAVLAMNIVSVAPAQGRPVNQWCPVLTEEEADPQITTVYQGRTVAFCCDRCREKFLADPQRYVGNLPASTESESSIHDQAHDVADTHTAVRDERSSATTRSTNDVPTDDAVGDEYAHGAMDSGPNKSRPPLLGRLHPIIVHLPVAGIPLALLGFLAWVATGRSSLASADVPPLAVATGAAVAAVISGNILHDSMRFSPSMHVILERHQVAGTTLMILSLCLAGLRLYRRNGLTGKWRWVYGIGLVIGSALVGVTGFFGGSLVYGPNHFTW